MHRVFTMYFGYSIVVVETNQLNYSLAKTRRLGIYVDRGKLRKPTPTISCMFSHHLNSPKIFFDFLTDAKSEACFPKANTVVFFQYFANYKLGKEYTDTPLPYATYFLNYVIFAAQVPNLVFNWINVFLNVG